MAQENNKTKKRESERQTDRGRKVKGEKEGNK